MKAWSSFHTFTLLGIIVSFIVSGLLVPLENRVLLWWILTGLLTAFAFVAAQGVTGMFWKGLFIDTRNKVSLSRLQTTLWTIIILSGFFTLAFWRLKDASISDPLAIEVQPDLWLLLGISTASLVGSTLIKFNKMQKPKDLRDEADTIESIAARTNTPPATVSQQIDFEGVLVTNVKSQKAEWSDLFRGEELGNENTIDLGKVQMFFFTVLLALVYAALLHNLLMLDAPSGKMPPLSPSMVTLLGISNAGYLALKAAPQTQEPE